MPVTFTMDLEGERVFSRRLMIVSDGIKDFTPAMREIGTELNKTWQQNFSSRGSLFGGWAPRKPQMKGGVRIDTWPLLERSGRMRGSFETDMGRDFIKLYNPTPYFKYHQSNKRRSKLPRRVMMKLRQSDREMVQKALQKYIVSLMRK